VTQSFTKFYTEFHEVLHRVLRSFFDVDCVEERYTEAFHFFRLAHG
jgi:hypothetical protein